ncbi:MAG: hypothetical protein WC752_02285 [Patescibacteria group bacterium]|jgi:hypothetical protein
MGESGVNGPRPSWVKIEMPPPPEPEKKVRQFDHVLDGMSDKDKNLIYTLRTAFERRGKNQKWYYPASGYDVVPLLISPEGTKHSFVDPIYHEEVNGQNNLRQRLESSFLRKSSDITHEDREKGLHTELTDGSAIEWIAEPAQQNESVPEDLDAIYTNFISTEPNPEVLKKLKESGLYIIDAPENRAQNFINHPAGVRSLEDCGFRLLKGNIGLDSLKVGDAGGLLNYSQGSSHNFNIWEKTRQFSPEEQADIIINYASIRLFTDLIGFINRMNNRETTLDNYSELVDDFTQSFSTDFQDFVERINHDLPAEQRSYAISRFQEHFAQRFFGENNVQQVYGWLIETDKATNENYLTKYHNPDNTRVLYKGLIAVVENAKKMFVKQFGMMEPNAGS